MITTKKLSQCLWRHHVTVLELLIEHGFICQNTVISKDTYLQITLDDARSFVKKIEGVNKIHLENIENQNSIVTHRAYKEYEKFIYS